MCESAGPVMHKMSGTMKRNGAWPLIKITEIAS